MTNSKERKGKLVLRIGVDFGGTKIEAAAIFPSGEVAARHRTANPGDYAAAVEAVVALVSEVEAETGARFAAIGVGAPGSISPKTGLMRNANSAWLNGMPFREDLQAALGRPVRVTNDANCLALSEAMDGAAAGETVVFAAILGTGCGGGVAVRGEALHGANGIAGEWGHTPLPWPRPEEYPGPRCWCGRDACMETFVSGKGFEADYARATGRSLSAEAVMASARAGEPDATAAFDRYVDRLGRGLAVICDVIDPDAIVLGGGMSNIPELYARLPDTVARHAFSDAFATRILQAKHGDSSGVRGAAWLWPLEGGAP